MIYLVVFALSIITYFISDRVRQKYIRNILLIVSLIVPVLLAAYRGTEIGTDIKTYVLPSYNIASTQTKFTHFVKNNYFVTDIAFNTLVYICARIFKSFHALLGIIQLLISLPVYVVIRKKLEKSDRTVAISFYYFIFYCLGLNIMRQSIAIAFGILALCYFEEEKRIKYIIFLIIALGFHKSALFVLIITFVYYINKRYHKKYISYLCAIGIISSTVFFQQLMLVAVKLFPNLLAGYVDYILIKELNIPYVELALYGYILLAGIKLINDKNSDKRFLGLMSLCSIAGVFISSLMVVVGRIMIYCNYFAIFSINEMKMWVKKNDINYFLVIAIDYIIIMLYWFIQYIYLKNNEVYPFYFEI